MKVSFVIEIDTDNFCLDELDKIIGDLYEVTELLESVAERETQSKENIQEH